MAIDSTLVNKTLAAKAVTTLAGKLAPFVNFSVDFSDEVRDKRSMTVLVPITSTGSGVLTNPTNFEQGIIDASAATVTMAHLSAPFTIGASDFNKGFRLETLAEQAAIALAQKIEATVFSNVTEANFGSATVTGVASGALSVANMKTLWAATPGDTKVGVVKDSEFAAFLPSDLNSYSVNNGTAAFGYDSFGRSSYGFTAAGTKVCAFAAHPSAIAIASAIPEYAPSVQELVYSEVLEVPGLKGLHVQANLWGSTASRAAWGSFDVLFGASVANSGALKIAKNV